MTYPHHHPDSISTVQLSPFGEDQWHRIVTYSPFYVHWTDMLMMSHHHQPPPPSRASTRLNLIGSIDINSLKLDDELLLNELQVMRKAATIPSLVTSKRAGPVKQSTTSTHEEKRPTSPIDENGSSSGFEHETIQTFKHHSSFAQSSSSIEQQQHETKQSMSHNPPISVRISSMGPLKSMPNIRLGPKPQPSLGVQMRQSAIARENALSAANDHRSSSPLSIASSRRSAGGSANLRHQRRVQHSQTPPLRAPAPVNNNISGGLYEQPSMDSFLPRKKQRTRSKNSSRSTMHMVKAKNERQRLKQQIELKTVLVEPWQRPFWNNDSLEESIPNSLEVMHQMGGKPTVFERNLRRTYHQQLNQFRKRPPRHE